MISCFFTKLTNSPKIGKRFTSILTSKHCIVFSKIIICPLKFYFPSLSKNSYGHSSPILLAIETTKKILKEKSLL